MADDTPTIGERITHDLFLAPGLHPDKGALQEALETEIDETAERAKAVQHPESIPPERD